MYFFGLLLPVIAFLFESYPRILNRKFGVDVWTHLLYLKEFHRQKGIPKRIKKGFLVPGVYDYPPIFIMILSKFPFKWVEKYEFFFSPFFDALHLILIYFIVYQMTGSVPVSLVTQLLYILTPIIVLENSSATPRSLGYLLFTCTFMLIFAFIQLQSLWFILLAILLGSFVFLSHRFTAQGFLFYSLFFSIYDRNLIYFLVFVLSFIIAIIISKGFYITVLKGHLGNLKFWYKNIKYRYAHQIKGTYKEHKTKDVVFKFYNQFLKFPPFVLTITNPWTLPVFFMLFFSYPTNVLYQHLLWWVIFSYILALVTTCIPSLRFLGEGQRYLELSAFPTAFIGTMQLFIFVDNSKFIYVLNLYILTGVAALFTILVIQRKAIVKEEVRTITSGMQEMFDYLRMLKKKPRLLCIPHQITTNTIYHTDCPVFVNADYATIDKISDVYPYFKKPIRSIMMRHKLDMILLNQNYARIADLRLKKFKIIKKFREYVLIKPIL